MRLALPLLLLVGLFAAAFALDRPEPPAELNLAYIFVQTLDPTQMQSSEDIRFGYAMFEGLCTFNPDTFTIEPGVAESWDVDDDRLRYTFHLRDDARWANGDAVTAGDFIATWRQTMLPDFAGPYHEFLMYIRGGQAYFDWAAAQLKRIEAEPDPAAAADLARRRIADYPARFDALVAARAVDDRTLVVELERRVPYFLETVACWPLFPLHATTRDAAEYDPQTHLLRRPRDYTKAGRFIGNGPYRLAAWRFKREIRLDANPHYWNRPPDMPRTVAAVCFADNHLAAFNAYNTGAIDLYLGASLPFNADLVHAAEQGRRNDVHANNNWGTYFYGFNCRPKLSDGRANPIADPRVRRALALTVDKRAIVRDVTRLNQQIARTFIPPDSIDGYTAPKGLDCLSDADSPEQRKAMIDRARALLAEAGYADPADLPPIELMYNTGGGHENVAQAVANMWEQALGVRVVFRSMEWKIFLHEYNAGNFMVARASWFGDYGDPTTFLNLFQTGNGNNDTGFSDPHYDGLLDQAAQTLDPAERFDLLEQAEAYAVDRMRPILPLYHYRLIHLYDPQRVSGVSAHPRNIQMFHRMKVTR